jgi:hypothetical protein
MTGKEFMQAVTNGQTDILQLLLNILDQTGTTYCVIGGLAVNAYTEPVVSLDLDLVVISEHIGTISQTASSKGMKVQEFEHRVNLSGAGSDLRIQLQTDTRYQDFLSRAVKCEILGYRMSVASIEDVLQGKIWAYSDESRRKSKRQKDLADIMRLVETHPSLREHLPPELLSEID